MHPFGLLLHPVHYGRYVHPDRSGVCEVPYPAFVGEKRALRVLGTLVAVGLYQVGASHLYFAEAELNVADVRHEVDGAYLVYYALEAVLDEVVEGVYLELHPASFLFQRFE